MKNIRKISVFTPTCNHDGLKVLALCLSRQTFEDFDWIIIDKDYDLMWFQNEIQPLIGNIAIYLPEKVQYPKRRYGLCNARNTLFQFLESDLLIEIQDYHWFPHNTLQRFWNIYTTLPDAIVTGTYKIVKMSSLYKCFEKEVLVDSDLEIIDNTCRPHNVGLQSLNGFTGWECNFSSIPTGLLKLIGEYPEDLDDYYENDILHISMNAKILGLPILMDTDMDYYSFEHKALGSDELDRKQYTAHVNFRKLWREHGFKLRQWEELNRRSNQSRQEPGD